jgi:hypothetical protein
VLQHAIGHDTFTTMNVPEKPAPDTPLQSTQKAKRERSNLCKVLPTDRIAFDRQVEILRAYAACYESNGGKPVSNRQAGETLTPKFSASTLGVAVPFFTDISLLTRNGNEFVPSPELVAWNQAVALSPSEAKRKLRAPFENTWFYKLLTPRLRLSAQSITECVGILAVEAKAEEGHLERVAPLIEFLELAGIVEITGTMVSFIPAVGESRTALDMKLPPGVPETFSTQEEHSLFLDKEKTKKFTINSPLFITRADYERIIKWIEVTLIIDDSEAKAA